MGSDLTYGRSLALSGIDLLVGVGGHGVLNQVTDPGTTQYYLRNQSSGQFAFQQELPGAFALAPGPLAIQGDILAIASPGRWVTVMKRTGTTWEILQQIQAAQVGNGLPNFAMAVDIRQDLLVIGAQGGAYVYEPIGQYLSLQQKVTPPSDASGNFGSAVALSSDRVLVGDWTNNELGQDAGAAYVYRRTDQRQGQWFLDLTGNGKWNPYLVYGGETNDTPVVGDWNGDGKDEIGIWRTTTAGNGYSRWILDVNGSGVWEASDRGVFFGMGMDKPVVGDWNGDGKDELGVFRFNAPIGYYQWLLDANGNGVWDGGDITWTFGGAGDLPVVGDWDGDGLDQIGVFHAGTWILDTNRNGRFGPGDRVFVFGAAGDIPLVGNWTGLRAGGKDQIGIRRGQVVALDQNNNRVFDPADWVQTLSTAATVVAGSWNNSGKDTLGFYVDGQWTLPGCPLIDSCTILGGGGHIPVVGDFNGDGRAAERGVFANGAWALDYNANGRFDGGDIFWKFGRAGDLPVVGDWNNDGTDEIGVFRNGRWFLDANRNGVWDPADLVWMLGKAGDRPVVGDWNGDGKDEIGVFRNGWWFLDANRNSGWDGMDLIWFYGQAGDVPVVGDWNGDGRDDIGIYHAGAWGLDQNHNGIYDARDFRYFFGGAPGDIPLVGDWTGSHKSKIGIFR